MRAPGAILVVLALCSGCGGPDPRSWLTVPELVIETPGTVVESENAAFRLVSGTPARTPFWTYDCPVTPNARNSGLGEYLGGQRVRVRHPATDQVLYGIFSLCHVHPGATGPVARSYSIRVPDEYVYDTGGGRVSVVYEPYTAGDRDLPAWALWLSRRPFPPPSREVLPADSVAQAAPRVSRW